MRPLLVASLVLLVAPAPARAGKEYKGPAHPTIPADSDPIDTSMADCMRASNEAIPGTDEEVKPEATKICALRAKHKAARERLLGGLAKLVADYREDTNHDHAQRLPDTIKAIQGIVKSCADALASQQYCHNIQCAEEPETNFILCDTKAAEVLELILK